jgi:anti-sigma-K factor RskA
MVHDDYKEMIPVRALSALEAAEDRALTDHLSSCAECRRELEEWENTSAALALVAEPLEPSRLVRERILAEVREDARPKDSARVVPFPAARKNVWSSIGNLGAIAAAIVFVALMAGVVVLWRENRANQSIIASMTTQLESMKADQKHREEVLAFLAAPSTKFSQLAGTNMAPAANAKLAYDKTGHAMLMTSGLPAAPQGMGYQLWFIVGGTPLRGKVFTTDNTGRGMLEDEVPSAARESAAFAITLEPMPNGSEKPTSKIYLSS